MNSPKKIAVSLILVIAATLGFFFNSQSKDLVPNRIQHSTSRPTEMGDRQTSDKNSPHNTVGHETNNQQASQSGSFVKKLEQNDNDSIDDTREPSPANIPPDPYKQLRESANAADYTHSNSASYLDKTLKLSPDLNQDLAPQNGDEQNSQPEDLNGQSSTNPYEQLKARRPNGVHPERDTRNYLQKTIQLGGTSSN